MTHTILVIDDEEDIRNLLGEIFEDEGYDVVKAAHSEQALSLLGQNDIDLIVLDIWLDNSDMDGMQILKYLKTNDGIKMIPVLMISGHGNVEMAVNAMKMGAFDFIEKPFKIDHILLTVQRALEQKFLKEENSRLKGDDIHDPVSHRYKSPAMLSLMKSIEEHADSEARVLIAGEIGTGKTRLARIIHDVSKRSDFPIRYLNAVDTTIDTLEDELTHNHRGTTVLENVDKLNKKQQGELLGYLNTMSNHSRLICTCDISIDNQLQQQTFSSSLYDRLAIIRHNAPNLNNRIEDIPLLIEEFISTYQNELGVSFANVFPPTEKLKKFHWGGNVKQLKTCVEWMVFCQIKHDGQEPIYTLPFTNSQENNVIAYPNVQEGGQGDKAYSLPLKEAREEFEAQYLSYMLSRFDGNIAKIASFINMDRTALHRKLKAMNLSFDTTNNKAESS